MVICLECDADLHMAQLITLPLAVSCFSKIQIGFSFLVPAHPGSPGQRAVKRVCVCARACVHACVRACVCAIVGLMSILQHRRAFNDLGHPLCDNLRQGNWLMDYTAGRLTAYPATNAVRLSLLSAITHV